MGKEKLNKLALLAKAGCKASRWEVYKEFSAKIHRESERLRNAVRSQDALEEACYNALMYTISVYRSGGKSFYGLAIENIKRRIREHLRRHKEVVRGYAVIGMEYEDGEGKTVEVDVVDVLANVEEIADIREITERAVHLAVNDSCKLAILANWYHGFNDSETAAFLAKRFDKNPESARKTVQRFRSHCQRALA